MRRRSYVAGVPRFYLSWVTMAAAIAGTFSCSSADVAPAPSGSGSVSSGSSTTATSTTGGSGGSSTSATSGTGGSGGTAEPPMPDAGPTQPVEDASADTSPVSSPDAGADARSDGAAIQDAALDVVTGPRTTYDPKDFLKVDVTSIKNARGEVVSLYGTNIGGWLIHEAWMSPMGGVADESHMISTLQQRFGAATTDMLIQAYQDTWIEAADFPKIAAEGLNVVRLPIYYQNMMDAAGNWKLDAAGHIDFSRIDWAITEAAKAGLYTVPDLHGVPGSQNGWDHSGLVTGSPSFFRDTAAQAVALKFWTEFAKHYAGNSFVAGYDLLNEPNAATGETLWSFYDKAVAAVRAVDPDHIIVIESPWNWSQLPNPTTRKWTNVMYSNHNYQWMNNDQIGVMRSFVDGIMNDATSHLPTYKVPLLIGEFTLFGLLDSWTYGLGRFAEQSGINWTNWSYKVRTTNSTWGLYNLKDGENSDANVPDVTSDPQATILAKWKAWKTSEHFQRNNSLSDIIKKAATANRNIRRPVFTPVP
jgi:endoglucanase